MSVFAEDNPAKMLHLQPKSNTMKKKKAVFNWSGGKDSAHALLRAMESGEFEIVALLTTVNRETHRSTMHGIPPELLEAQSRSIGIPLEVVNLKPKVSMENRFPKLLVIVGLTIFALVFVFIQQPETKAQT